MAGNGVDNPMSNSRCSIRLEHADVFLNPCTQRCSLIPSTKAIGSTSRNGRAVSSYQRAARSCHLTSARPAERSCKSRWTTVLIYSPVETIPALAGSKYQSHAASILGLHSLPPCISRVAHRYHLPYHQASHANFEADTNAASRHILGACDADLPLVD